LEEVEKSGVTTHDLRAVGAVMQEARDLGLVESGGLVRRNDKHTRGATTLWESRLHNRSTHRVPATLQPDEDPHQPE